MSESLPNTTRAINTREAVAYLQIAVDTLRRFAQEGCITYLHYMVRDSDLFQTRYTVEAAE